MTKKFFERGKKIAKWADNNMTKQTAQDHNLTYEDGFAHGYEAHRAEQVLEQPSWQGLSDDEISHLKYLHVDYELYDEGEYGTECNVYVEEFARAIEQALKEKNT